MPLLITRFGVCHTNTQQQPKKRTLSNNLKNNDRWAKKERKPHTEKKATQPAKLWLIWSIKSRIRCFWTVFENVATLQCVNSFYKFHRISFAVIFFFLSKMRIFSNFSIWMSHNVKWFKYGDRIFFISKNKKKETDGWNETLSK